MAHSTLPKEPSSFDPAVYLHSESGDLQLPTPSNSDDLEALNDVHTEAIAKKNELGVVIQHRAWKVADVFRSEEDYHLETPCAKGSRQTNSYHLDSEFPDPPSSPPMFKMPLVSSPPIYPPSSSPPQNHDQRKRARPADPFEPVKKRLLFGRGSASAKPEVQQVAARATAAENASTNHHHFAESNLQSKGPFSEHNDEEILEPSLTMNLHNDLSTAELPLPVLPSIEQRSKHGTTIGQIRPELAACIRTARGIRFPLHKRLAKAPIPYEQIVASRSKTAPGRAKTSYYGIDIHKLIDDAVQESNQVAKATPVKENLPLQSIEASANTTASRKRTMMWTEKYRARKFTDLVGDERTHRTVLRWLKDWDPIVFPGNNKPKPRSKVLDENTEERPHRKILLLAGPPGLGKTTLAHVCAKQTGYEVVEINASDERSREVVKGRIRDSVGTENVRGVNMKTGDGNVRKAGRPVCVVVDEVDGVVGGSGGSGEGGFIKALIDLVMLDQKNTKSTALGASTTKKGKKGDQFRMLRPMILICNDVYHSALKPLRASGLAEIIHIRKPPLDKVVARMKTVFDREGILNDKDGVRRLCEATWGVSNRRESRTSSNNTGEGDIRGVLVVGEWVASKLRASSNLSLNEKPRLTKQWVETHMLADLGHGGGGSRGIGRGGAKEAVDRVFLDGAGFPKSVALPSQNMSQRDARVRVGVTELGKRVAIQRLREVIDTSGECERIMADCFTVYPSHHFQDDVFLSKPNAAYEWLHFHDTLSSRIFAGQEWELNPYLSQSILGFHHLFASPAKNSWSNDQQNQWNGDGEEDPLPFTGPRANFSAYETEKANRSLLQQLQSSLSAPLLRSFRSPEELATDLLPQLIKMLTPDIKPVIVGGSGDQRGTASVRREGEREMARRAVETMSAVNVTFERSRIEDARGGFGGFVYRMEPPLDTLSTFETSSSSSTTSAPTRYAVRQVLDQEFQKYLIRQRADARQARYTSGNPLDGQFLVDPNQSSHNKENLDHSTAKIGLNKATKVPGVKRDFFGRIITNEASRAGGMGGKGKKLISKKQEGRVWVSYHEGFSNAVRKPISLEALVKGLS